MKLKILGTEYRMRVGVLNGDDIGECDPCAKVLTIDVNAINAKCSTGVDEIMKSTKRHEIIHAFLYESGMTGYAESSGDYYHDDTIVDWFAVQAPKIFKAFKQADCL